MNQPAGPPVPWAAIPLFQSLRPAEREALRPLVRIRSYAEGEIIFREGDEAHHLHFVLGGRVKVVKSATGGHEIILEIFGTGDPVGVMAAYEERTFPAAAVALEAATLLSIPRDPFFALLGANPLLARALLLGLTRRMVELTRKLAERSARVEQRVARLFLTLAERFGRPVDGGIDLPVPLSRREIAELVATTQETAIRIMSRWGKEGLILTEGQGFHIPSPARLHELAGGLDDPGTG